RAVVWNGLRFENWRGVSERLFGSDQRGDTLCRGNGRQDFDDSPFLPRSARLRDRTRQINAESNPTLKRLRAPIVMKRIIIEPQNSTTHRVGCPGSRWTRRDAGRYNIKLKSPI